MTGGLMRVFTMRPELLHVLLLLLLPLTSDSGDSSCEPEVRIRRNTVYDAFTGGILRINCTVIFCNDSSQPSVTWLKLETGANFVNISRGSHKTEWTRLNHSVGISQLIFQKTLRNDSGVYQCRIGNNVSHKIKVSVHDNPEADNVTHKNDTNSSGGPGPEEGLMMYVYPAAGIVAFVIIVIIISVASMHGCKGKPKKDTPADTVYTAVPMSKQPLPRPGLQPSPRESPSAPPPRRSMRRKKPPTPNGHVYGEIRNSGEQWRQIAEPEEEGSVVYVALNHQLPVGGAARPPRPAEESSEYAAIRVQEPPPTRH